MNDLAYIYVTDLMIKNSFPRYFNFYGYFNTHIYPYIEIFVEYRFGNFYQKGGKKMVWNIIFLIIALFVAAAWMAFCVIQPLIILRVSLPAIKTMEKDGAIRAKEARRYSYIHLILWGTIGIAVIVLMILFANNFAWIGFAVGAVMTFFIGIGKTGPTRDNMIDFMLHYSRFILSNDETIIEGAQNGK